MTTSNKKECEMHGVEMLPNREEMLRRLIAYDDEPHFIERFYPLLLEHAGTEKAPEGLYMILQLALCDYTRGMPPTVAWIMRMKLPGFIEAICGEDLKAFGAATKDVLATVQKTVQQR